jgi:PAS domain S-box-containing protein
LLSLGLVCSNLIVFAFSGYTLYQSREQHELLAETTTRNVASALDQNLSNSVSRIDLALQAVADEMERQLAARSLGGMEMTAFLARQEQRLPEVEAFRIADAEGRVILGKGVDPAVRTSWADRDYFLHHREHNDRRMRVAPPRLGRVAKQYIVGFSMRYNTPDGRFAGVISAPMAVDSFTRIISGYDLGRYGTIVVRDSSGGLVTRVPPLPDKPVGQIGNSSISPELRRIIDTGQHETTYFTPTSADGYRRIVSFRRLANAPMLFIVGMASEDYLAAWKAEVYATGAMAGGFLLLSLLLGGLSTRMIRLVEVREAELESNRRNLARLVEERTAALMATEARATHLLESSADGLYGMDREARITFINPAGCAILGYAPEQIVGRDGHALFHHHRADGSAYPPETCPALRALRGGERVRVDDEVFWHADGHPVPVMYAVHPIFENGEITGAVLSFVDMTEQRAALAAREQAMLAAENLARIRREFLANMSHEIRTPLNGVLGFATIGQRNYQNPEKVLNAFDKIITSGNRLLGVINDVLDFSKIEAGKFTIEETRTHLAEVVSRAVDLVQDRAQAKGVALNVQLATDLPAVCTSDPLRLGQVLLNLLANAVKFTDTGRVSLSASRDGDWLVFRIVDTGIGMSEAQMTELFSPFQQADASATRRFGGTGLGLAISNRILELMGGSIRAESVPGEGSTFEFRVPCRLPDAGASKQLPSGHEVRPLLPLRGISVLLVEDDPVNQAMLEENLFEDGARVTLAANGVEAVARVRDGGEEAFDVVLMDLQLPEMDGFEATRRIHERVPGLPVIAQSAHAFSEERERCLSAGMVAHIAKPIDPDELVQMVRTHARQRAAAEPLTAKC